MISDEEIDKALMANITNMWRKVARVVGTAMMQIDRNERKERDDLYFAKRVVFLAEKGLIEYKGNLNQIGLCEIRLPQTKERDI